MDDEFRRDMEEDITKIVLEILLDRIEALTRGKANLETKVKHLTNDNEQLKRQLEDNFDIKKAAAKAVALSKG